MKLKQFLFAVCVGTMFAACSSDDATQSFKKDRTIHITADIKGSLVQTKAVENSSTLQNTQFYENASAIFYFWNNNTTNFISSVSWDLVYNYGSGQFDFCGTADGVVYPADGTAVDVFAIYPHEYYSSKTETGNISRDATSFFVAQNQSTDAEYRKSDLMYAFSANNTIENDPIELTFNHCLTKIIVKLPSLAKFNSATVKMPNIQLDKTLDFSDRTKVSLSQPASPTKGDISLGTYTTGNSLTAIIVPQNISPGQTVFEVTLTDATVYKFVANISYTFSSSNVYTFDLSSTDITSDNVSISEWEHMNDDTNVINGAVEKK